MCPICYSKAMTIPGPFGPHAGKLVCIKCGRWVRWVSKNEVEGKGKRESHRPRWLPGTDPLLSILQEETWFAQGMGASTNFRRLRLQPFDIIALNDVVSLAVGQRKAKDWQRNCMSKIKPYTNFNIKSGRSAHFVIEIPSEFILVVDTNEQVPLFISHGSITKQDYSGELISTRQSLWLGDYSIKGFETQVTVEWKTISDLYSSLFSDQKREWSKLSEISRYAHKWLVIGGLESDVLRFQDFSKVSPNSMRGRLADIEIRLRIPIYYAQNRLEAERFILYRLVKYFRLKRGGEIWRIDTSESSRLEGFLGHIKSVPDVIRWNGNVSSRRMQLIQTGFKMSAVSAAGKKEKESLKSSKKGYWNW